MAAHQTNPQIDLADTKRLGEFANAFRVLEGIGPHCYLDFLVYSARENHAAVVSRVRVQKDFLPLLRDRLDNTLMEIGPIVGRPFFPNGFLN